MVAFGIAVFVLLMQILWVWLDDIVGKGAGILVITEMVGYMSISMFPMALPIGVLLSSVMVEFLQHYYCGFGGAIHV